VPGASFTSQILRCRGRYATSQFGLIVKSNVKQLSLVLTCKLLATD